MPRSMEAVRRSGEKVKDTWFTRADAYYAEGKGRRGWEEEREEAQVNPVKLRDVEFCRRFRTEFIL